MTAGIDKTIRIFTIDCETNPLIQSIYIKELPILCGTFHNNGTEIIVSGRKPYMYVYDMIKDNLYNTKLCTNQYNDTRSFEKLIVSLDGTYIAVVGIDGNILLFHGKTKTFLTKFKNPVQISCIQFTKDSKYIIAFGIDGYIYIWDLRQKCCIQKYIDEGTIHGTALDISYNNSYIATGSDSGVTNIYTLDDIITNGNNTSSLLYNNNIKPKKTLLSLHTSISKIIFSPTNEFLITASRTKRDAISIHHIPSFTTYTNWPANNHSLRYIQDIDISPHGALLTIANERGKVLLYRLPHYTRV